MYIVNLDYRQWSEYRERIKVKLRPTSKPETWIFQGIPRFFLMYCYPDSRQLQTWKVHLGIFYRKLQKPQQLLQPFRSRSYDNSFWKDSQGFCKPFHCGVCCCCFVLFYYHQHITKLLSKAFSNSDQRIIRYSKLPKNFHLKTLFETALTKTGKLIAHELVKYVL